MNQITFSWLSGVLHGTIKTTNCAAAWGGQGLIMRELQLNSAAIKWKISEYHPYSSIHWKFKWGNTSINEILCHPSIGGFERESTSINEI